MMFSQFFLSHKIKYIVKHFSRSESISVVKYLVKDIVVSKKKCQREDVYLDFHSAFVIVDQFGRQLAVETVTR